MPADLGSDLTALAKELNLPQAQAQKFVDLSVKHAQALQGHMAKTFETTKAGWAEEVRNHPTMGGANMAANMATAKKAIVAFGTPALTGFLNKTGLGQHPAMLELLVNVGAAISEDTIENGGEAQPGGGGHRDHAKRLYPGMK